MTVDEFRASTERSPPSGASAALLALWHDARGEWGASHNLVQGDGSADGAWVHAYLHRKEGDLGNASYWCRRAKRVAPECASEAEWNEIAAALLNAFKR